MVVSCFLALSVNYSVMLCIILNVFSINYPESFGRRNK